MFKLRFQVRHYECNDQGRLYSAVYLQYLQQVAIEASAAAGFSLEWYDAHGTVWVVRKMAIEFLKPAFGGEELEITTWISAFHRVRALREYEVYRVSKADPDEQSDSPLLPVEATDRQRDEKTISHDSRELIARAQADWVYIDRQTNRPSRIPQEATILFAPESQVALPLHTPDPPVASRVSHQFCSRRWVQHYELDSMVHVNHAVYLNWLEQAVFDACTKIGLPQRYLRENNMAIVQRRHEVEYFRPALSDDEVEIASHMIGQGQSTSTWQQDISCVMREGQVLASPLHLARSYNRTAFLTLEGQPACFPAQIIEALAPTI
jgi:acyl-CoA thioester hydrolase